jgi:hypothetical protein
VLKTTHHSNFTRQVTVTLVSIITAKHSAWLPCHYFALFLKKSTLQKDAHFSNIYHHTKFQDLLQTCSSAVSIWTSPDGKMHNQTDHISTDKRRHLSINLSPIFRGANYNTDHYLVLAGAKESLLVNK